MPLAILVYPAPHFRDGHTRRRPRTPAQEGSRSRHRAAGTLLYTAAVYWMLALIGASLSGSRDLRKNPEPYTPQPSILKKQDTTATT